MPVQSPWTKTDSLDVQMSQDPQPPEPPHDAEKKLPMNAAKSEGEAWTILSYLLSGLLLWTGAGALLDHWLGTHFLLPIGMFVGAGAGLYLVWIRFGKAPQ